MLHSEWADGQPHELVLQGWTGLGDDWNTSTVTRTVMRPCAIVQIDQPTRDFITSTRIALGTAKILDSSDPVRIGLLDASLDNALRFSTHAAPHSGERFYNSVLLAVCDPEQCHCRLRRAG